MLWLALRFPRFALDVFHRECSLEKNHTLEFSAEQLNQQATVVAHKELNRTKVLYANDVALAHKVYPGINLVTAQALLEAEKTEHEDNNANNSGPIILERDIRLEWKHLQWIADFCYDYTPYVKLHNTPLFNGRELNEHSLEQTQQTQSDQKQIHQNIIPPHSSCSEQSHLQPGVILEISGSLKLFSGLKNIQENIIAELRKNHINVSAGIGHTPEAAWVLSNYHSTLTEAHTVADYIHSMSSISTQALDCHQEVFKRLNKMGVSTLGELFSIPTAELGKRFGKSFLHYLQCLKGNARQALVRPKEIHQFKKKIDLDFPVQNTQLLEHAVSLLIYQLLIFLKKEQLQCEGVEWTLGSVNEHKKVVILCQPIHFDGELLKELTKLHFDHLSLTFEVNHLELKLIHFSSLNHINDEIFSLDQSGLNPVLVARQWQLLLTKLHNRLGKQSTQELSLQPEHLPELLNTWQASDIRPNKKQSNLSSGKKNTKASNASQSLAFQSLDLFSGDNHSTAINQDTINSCENVTAPKPAWLLHPPVSLKANNNQELFWQGKLTILLGPERIQGHWWDQSRHHNRDYFIAEQDDCRRVWIYHDRGQDQWFLHGVFS
ncbi:Y-family DNA polymerase [Sessilibacter corallicola]|uniref:DNA polymerase Y family protein n=1 Tax=Sessilibacter corallicola TaxID=2904075 RepID=A0ABQ0A876_9GAMM